MAQGRSSACPEHVRDSEGLLDQNRYGDGKGDGVELDDEPHRLENQTRTERDRHVRFQRDQTAQRAARIRRLATVGSSGVGELEGGQGIGAEEIALYCSPTSWRYGPRASPPKQSRR